jgi:hypothetical protein
MTLAATVAAVTRHWGTGVVISDVALGGIVRDGFAHSITPEGPAFERITPESVVTDMGALEAEFTSSMTALATSQELPPVQRADIEVQVWRAGYDLPATSYPAEFVGWCFLAASPSPQHSESGALAFADPRAGSALTAMPGLPWGRQVMIRPTAGAHAAVPGWLTCSVVPVETGQFAVVAVASSAR